MELTNSKKILSREDIDKMFEHQGGYLEDGIIPCGIHFCNKIVITPLDEKEIRVLKEKLKDQRWIEYWEKNTDDIHLTNLQQDKEKEGSSKSSSDITKSTSRKPRQEQVNSKSSPIKIRVKNGYILETEFVFLKQRVQSLDKKDKKVSFSEASEKDLNFDNPIDFYDIVIEGSITILPGSTWTQPFKISKCKFNDITLQNVTFKNNFSVDRSTIKGSFISKSSEFKSLKWDDITIEHEIEFSSSTFKYFSVNKGVFKDTFSLFSPDFVDIATEELPDDTVLSITNSVWDNTFKVQGGKFNKLRNSDNQKENTNSKIDYYKINNNIFKGGIELKNAKCYDNIDIGSNILGSSVFENIELHDCIFKLDHSQFDRGVEFTNIAGFLTEESSTAKIIFDQSRFGTNPSDNVRFTGLKNLEISLQALTWGCIPRFVEVNFEKATIFNTDWRTSIFQGCTWKIQHYSVPYIDHYVTIPYASYYVIHKEEEENNENERDYENEEDNENEEDEKNEAYLLNAENIYRQLKQNHEDQRDFATAGEFHYSEKEMRRKYLSQKRKRTWTEIGHWFLLSIYKWISGYGERWLRPLIWILLLMFGMPILYLQQGLTLKDESHLHIKHFYVDSQKWEDKKENKNPHNVHYVQNWATYQYVYGIALEHSTKFFIPFQEKLYVIQTPYGSLLSFFHTFWASVLSLLLITSIRQKVKR